MAPGSLRDAAPSLDQRLRQCRYQTIIHGDAKAANFCRHQSADQVAAVDFQYVGRGCGIIDVMYAISSTLRWSSLRAASRRATQIL